MNHPCNLAKAHESQNLLQASLWLDSSNFALYHRMILATAEQSRRNRNLVQHRELKDMMSLLALVVKA